MRVGVKYSKPSVPLGTPTLPMWAVTHSGVHFDPNLDCWNYGDGIDKVNIDFTRLRTFICSDLILSYKAVLMHISFELQPRTLVAYSREMECLFNLLRSTDQLAEICLEHIKEYWVDAKLKSGRCSVRSTLLRWNDLRYAGLDALVVPFLNRKKLPPFIANESVLTWDPFTGPFTDIEFQGLSGGLLEAYGERRMPKYLFLIAWLAMSLGLRPRQIALLKVCDIAKVVDGAITSYQISIPRIKQVRQQLRDEMHVMPLIADIGEILYSFSLEMKEDFRNLIENPLGAPLFCSAEGMACALENESVRRRRDLREDDFEDDDKYLGGENWGPGYEYHMRAAMVGVWVEAAFNTFETQSERVGSSMRVNARRFRKSYGTRLARNNVAPVVMAKMMGHANIKSTAPYIAATSDLHLRLDRAMAFEMAPLAQAFKGELLTDWSDETDAPAIRDLRIAPTGEPMGKCGKHGFCGFAAPIACYTCKKFRPWRDGPHDAVFDYLWNKREQKSASVGKRELDMVALHDQTIVAVARVILLCKSAEGKERV